jgi:hypothetical protein
MRTGYAAFVLGKYSQSLKYYTKTYLEDHEDTKSIALYYVYLNHLYLNNMTAARYYLGKMSSQARKELKQHKIRLSLLNVESSYKMPSDSTRGNGLYGRIGFNTHQTISEPKFSFVTENQLIKIEQKEYYAKLIFALGGRLSLIGGYHYLYTPFNNYTYNNHIGFIGIKHTWPKFHLQGMFHYGQIADSAYQQVDISMTTFPLGNSKLYTISKGAYGDDFTFSQIAGIQLLKSIWLEGNVTLGEYNILLDKDALYLFNDIDTKKFKAGTSLYILAGKKMMISLNYIFEKKVLYGTTANNFYQHSTTGGLQWNF